MKDYNRTHRLPLRFSHKSLPCFFGFSVSNIVNNIVKNRGGYSSEGSYEHLFLLLVYP